MTEMINCCPECDSSEIVPLTGGLNKPTPEHDWRCEDCGHECIDPARREAVRDGTCVPRHGPAETLAKAEPPEGTISEWLENGGPDV